MNFSCFTRRSFQNVHQPWWTVYNDFYPVATEATSNLLSLAWRLRLHPIVGSNDPKPRPKCALSARKCIVQYRLKFQIIHCQFFFPDPPLNNLGHCVSYDDILRVETTWESNIIESGDGYATIPSNIIPCLFAEPASDNGSLTIVFNMSRIQ